MHKKCHNITGIHPSQQNVKVQCPMHKRSTSGPTSGTYFWIHYEREIVSNGNITVRGVQEMQGPAGGSKNVTGF